MALIKPTRRLITRQRKRANLARSMLWKLGSEEGELSNSPSNVEVPLGAEEAHVHLHLGVQVAHTHLDIKWLRPRFFL